MTVYCYYYLTNDRTNIRVGKPTQFHKAPTVQSRVLPETLNKCLLSENFTISMIICFSLFKKCLEDCQAVGKPERHYQIFIVPCKSSIYHIHWGLQVELLPKGS